MYDLDKTFSFKGGGTWKLKVIAEGIAVTDVEGEYTKK